MMFEKLYEELIGNKERLTLFFYFADGKEHEVSELLKAWGSKDLTKYYFKSLQELGFIYSDGKTAKLTVTGKILLSNLNDMGMI